MFSKLAFFVAATMAIVVSAAPSPKIENSCNTGPVQCCNDVRKVKSDEGNIIKSLLHIDIPVGTDVGFKCSPLTLGGIGGGSSCQSKPVCCSNNSFNGVIAIGCSPINVNL